MSTYKKRSLNAATSYLLNVKYFSIKMHSKSDCRKLYNNVFMLAVKCIKSGKLKQHDNKILSLAKIIKNQLEYCVGYAVDINSAYSWVNIYDESEGNEGDNSLFMQGHEAEDFIDKVEKLFNKVRIVSYKDCALFEASQYIENCLN